MSKYLLSLLLLFSFQFVSARERSCSDVLHDILDSKILNMKEGITRMTFLDSPTWELTDLGFMPNFVRLLNRFKTEANGEIDRIAMVLNDSYNGLMRDGRISEINRMDAFCYLLNEMYFNQRYQNSPFIRSVAEEMILSLMAFGQKSSDPFFRNFTEAMKGDMSVTTAFIMRMNFRYSLLKKVVLENSNRSLFSQIASSSGAVLLNGLQIIDDKIMAHYLIGFAEESRRVVRLEGREFTSRERPLVLIENLFSLIYPDKLTVDADLREQVTEALISFSDDFYPDRVAPVDLVHKIYEVVNKGHL